MGKTLELGGYGKVHLNPVKINDSDYETVDQQGRPIEKEMIGEGRKTVYRNADGVELASNQLCKKIVMDGDEMIIPKMTPTTKIDAEDIEVEDTFDEVYKAIERKIYNAVTDSKKINELLEEGKALKFPFAAGNGWKVYQAVLCKLHGRTVMIGCRGNMDKALEVFQDDTVSIDMDMAPKQQSAKKLLKAISY